MDAEEARRRTNENLKGPAIEKYVKHIDARIKDAVNDGKGSIHNPQVGDPKEGTGESFYLKPDEERAVRLHYENDKYIWTDHPDPDPGSPVSNAYTTLSW
ncbi:hypothetical protein [Neptuniibacter sp. QD37_11]|uniref:hypothetical protein n=1 Tax=Neptuniibacter sp. QD37_11 TaxID=3398209 RepID=UPI0039F57850